jgi:hypothetical protein
MEGWSATDGAGTTLYMASIAETGGYFLVILFHDLTAS